jgi:hypothetical protein
MKKEILGIALSSVLISSPAFSQEENKGILGNINLNIPKIEMPIFGGGESKKENEVDKINNTAEDVPESTPLPSLNTSDQTSSDIKIEENEDVKVQNETISNKQEENKRIIIPNSSMGEQISGGASIVLEEEVVEEEITPPSYHPELMLTVNSSLMPECSEIYSINIALTNSILNDNEEIGRRDTVRALNSCMTEFMSDENLKNMAALSIVSLKSTTCNQDECSPVQYKMIAENVISSQNHIVEILGNRFYDHLVNECIPGFASDCVKNAALKVSTHISMDELEWAKLNDSNRVYGVFNPEVDMVVDNLDKFIKELGVIKGAARRVFTKSGRFSTPQNEPIGLDIKDSLSDEITLMADGKVLLSIYEEPSVLNGGGVFIRLINEVSSTKCKTIVENYPKELKVNNLFVNSNLVPKIPNENNIFYCQPGDKNVIEILY